MTLPLLLRGAVLALLAAALFLPPAVRRGGAAAPAWIDGPRALARAADSLLVGAAPPALIRATSAPPREDELELLAAAARRAPLYAALPASFEGVEAEAPARPLSGRAAAVAFRLRGAPEDSVTVRLLDETGVLDSLRVRTDGAGRYAGAFRVRPPRAGWREWTVQAGTATARTGAWVDSADAPRVLVRAGMPHWEAKFVVRALEESGAVVETVYDLGRGLAVAAGGGAVTAERLARSDAVVVLHAAPLPDGERRMLAEWAAERGGGVLLAGRQGSAGGFALASAPRGRAVDGPALRWSLPPELAPLPADPVRSAALVYADPPAGATVAAAGGDGAVLSLRPLGRGRAAALGLTETWRWRMEAGRVREHREFWRALVDWLSTPQRAPFSVAVPEPVVAAGARREVRVYAPEGGEVPPLAVTRPGGGVDTLPLTADPAHPGVHRAALVAADTGLHTFALGDGPPVAGLRATDAAPSADGWARLSMLAHASGGGMLPADSLRPLLARLTPEDARRPLPVAWLLFAAVLAAAAAEWAIRRLRGAA